MRKTLPVLLLVLCTSISNAQKADTITLNVGHVAVNGRKYKPHLASVVQSTSKDGLVIKTNSYLLDTFVNTWKGDSVFQLIFTPSPGETDQAMRVETELDLRTLALVHREETDGTGRLLSIDMHGAHVVALERANRTAAPTPVDYTLETPSYLLSFVDAAIGATPFVRPGQVFRVPVFELSPARRKTDWHVFRVVRRDTVTIQKRSVNAWVLLEEGHARYISRELWLIDEPPYLPRVITHTNDGLVQLFTSDLIRLHS